MDRQELKDWLRERLKLDSGFEVLWQQLEKDHVVSEFEQGYIDKNTVLSMAREKVRDTRDLGHALGIAGRAAQPRANDKGWAGKPQEIHFEVELDDYEAKRARAYEEVLAREAGQTEEVVNFRREVLGDGLLTLEQAHELLESPAARFLQPALFKHWRIPLIGHTAKVLEYDSGRGKRDIDHRVTLKIEPLGITKTVRYANDDAAQCDGRAIDWHWYLHEDAEGHLGLRPEECVLRYRDRDGLKEEIWVWPASVLDVLRSFSARWARIYGWEEEDMTLWLLSGEPPRFDPLKVRIRYKAGSPLTVVLTAQPWLSAKTVQNNYLKLQRQLFDKGNYRLASRSLDVLRFVERRTREEGKRPSFRELLEEWNRECTEEERFADLRNFARAYRETLERVAHHPFSLPVPKPLPLAAKRKRARKVVEAEGIMERFMAASKTTEDSNPLERGDEGEN